VRRLSVVFLFALAGCGAMVRGTAREVSLQSEPQDADVALDGRVVGRTPLKLALDKRSGKVLSVHKPGYAEASFPLLSRRQGVTAFDPVGALARQAERGIDGLRQDGPKAFTVKLSGTGMAAAPAPARGDWETLRESGPPEDLFAYLSSIDYEDAQGKTKALRPGRRRALEEHILAAAGKKTMSWRYTLNPDLPYPRRRYAVWFLTEFTSYKP
jgi:hypothetical protein